MIKKYLLQIKYFYYEQPYNFFKFRTDYIKNYNFQHIFEYKFNTKLLIDNTPLTHSELIDSRRVKFLDASEHTINDKYNTFKKKVYTYRLRWDRWQKYITFGCSDDNKTCKQSLGIIDKWLNSSIEDEYTKLWVDKAEKNNIQIKIDKPKSIAELLEAHKLSEMNKNKFSEMNKDKFNEMNKYHSKVPKFFKKKIKKPYQKMPIIDEIYETDETDEIYEIDKIVDKHDEFIEMYKLTFKDFNNKLFRSGSKNLNELYNENKFDKINGSFDEDQFTDWDNNPNKPDF